MSKLGVYGWIRESVRRAVLMGFSDAVEQLGSGADGDEISPQLLAVLRQPQALLATSAPPVEASAAAPKSAGRKRLGQTLNEIHQRSGQSPSA